MQTFLTLKNVADILQVKPYRIGYVLAAKLVPEPALRIGNKRVFSQDDITRLAAHFGVTLPDASVNVCGRSDWPAVNLPKSGNESVS